MPTESAIEEESGTDVCGCCKTSGSATKSHEQDNRDRKLTATSEVKSPEGHHERAQSSSSEGLFESIELFGHDSDPEYDKLNVDGFVDSTGDEAALPCEGDDAWLWIDMRKSGLPVVLE